MTDVDHTTLHRTAKYFMDNARVGTHRQAMELLAGFGLSIHIAPEVANTRNGQIALLTLVNLARRTFLGGVEVAGSEGVDLKVDLGGAVTLDCAVTALGGALIETTNGSWPTVTIGGERSTGSSLPSWALSWSGWRCGVVGAAGGETSCDAHAIPLAPAAAAAICAAEVFAFYAKDHPLAGRRSVGLSLWRPGHTWSDDDRTEPALHNLPSRLWLIGLGNLGQAYAWLLACLPFPRGSTIELVLQDFDTLADSNESTSVLTSTKAVGKRKTRWLAKWLDARGFTTTIEERRFSSSTRRDASEPGVALCGVDNAPARAWLEDAGFDLVVEAGLGAGVQSFRSFSMHTFPGSRAAREIWGDGSASREQDPTDLPAYRDLKQKGLDQCGLAQLASRTVGAPFVGLLAGVFVVSELLRRLHGGAAYEVIASSVLNLSDIQAAPTSVGPYAHGHVSVR